MKLIIKGRILDFYSIKEAIDFVLSLSSDINYFQRKRNYHIYISGKENDIYKNLLASYGDAQLDSNKILQELITLAESNNNILMKAKVIFEHAYNLLKYDQEDFLLIFQYIESAVSICEKEGFFALLRSELSVIYDFFMKSRVTNELTEFIQNKIGEHAFKETGFFQNKNAYVIEQGEFGISNGIPMGTYNLHTCIALSVFDDNGNGMLAHIDPSMNFQEVEGVLRQYFNCDSLSAILVGASFYSPNPQVAYGNLYNVLNFLSEIKANICAMSLGYNAFPSSIVFHPADGSISEEYPAKLNVDQKIAQIASSSISSGVRMTNFSLNLINDAQRVPVFFSKKDVMRINMLIGSNIWDIYNNRVSSISNQSMIAIIDSLMKTKEVYFETIEKISQIIKNRIDDILNTGILLAPWDSYGEDLDAIPKIFQFIIHTLPLYLGENSMQYNAPLIEFINEDLYEIYENGSYRINLESFKGFDFFL